MGENKWSNEFEKDVRNIILEQLELEKHKPESTRNTNMNNLIDTISGDNKEIKDILIAIKTIEELKNERIKK